ncbi:MAG: hypothetical protein R3F62_18995 [Planctomycetota bacterium]
MRATLLLLLPLLGCSAQHYLVSSEAAPLYDGDGAVVATLSRYDSGRIEDDSGPRLEVESRAGGGFLDRSDVRVFRALEPAWDGGADERAQRATALRALRVELEGRGWSPAAQQAVVEGKITRGMTREQVEVAWGWPERIDPSPQGEVWIYERQGTSVQRVDPPYLWPYGYGYGFGVGWRRGYAGFYGPWRPWQRMRLELPVLREFSVAFDHEGVVTQVTRRTLLED